jgi:hypothetical protein
VPPKSLFAHPVTWTSRKDIAVYVSLSSYSLVKEQTEQTVEAQNQTARSKQDTPKSNPRTKPSGRTGGAYLVIQRQPVNHLNNKTQRRVFRSLAAVPPAFLSRVIGVIPQPVNGYSPDRAPAPWGQACITHSPYTGSPRDPAGF